MQQPNCLSIFLKKSISYLCISDIHMCMYIRAASFVVKRQAKINLGDMINSIKVHPSKKQKTQVVLKLK